MQLDIRHVNLEVSDALHEFTRRAVERALRPFSDHIARVDVRIVDVNGPRGGVDKQCTLVVEVPGEKRDVVVKSTSSDAYEAVQAACARLGQRVSSVLARRRTLERQGAPAPAEEPASSAGTRIQVTTADHDELRSLIDARAGTRDEQAAEALADELDRAELVPRDRIAGNVVTMHSRVVFEDVQTGATREVSLVYPHEADLERGRISILAPVGSALLGLSVGQTIDWPMPRGELGRFRIVEIVDQPEAASGARV